VFSIGYDFHVGNGATGANNGNVWGITNYKDNSRNQSFTYDSLNRLTSAQNAGTDCTKKTLNLNQTEYWGNNYGYDPWGNLTSKTVTKCSAEHLNAPALVNNQLSGYGYDAAGNMTTDPPTVVSRSATIRKIAFRARLVTPIPMTRTETASKKPMAAREPFTGT
jgi:hypothetical protein